MYLRFERGAVDDESKEMTICQKHQFVQITYGMVRDENGEDIACLRDTENGERWVLVEDESEWTDIVIAPDERLEV